MQYVKALLCTSDGQTLYFSDCGNNRLRCVDLKTRAVKTVCGDGQYSRRDGVGLNASFDSIHQICFDRSRTTKSESVIFIASNRGVRRFDIASGSYPLPVTACPFGSDSVCFVCVLLCRRTYHARFCGQLVWDGVYERWISDRLKIRRKHTISGSDRDWCGGDNRSRHNRIELAARSGVE